MPKHGWLTPKAIANRIKAKGLQKLRWYCQMCQKQCRDENGFKCHTMSESHQRQLLLVAESPGKYVHAFSEEFLHGFMTLLRLQYGTRRVHANEVYQEYIKDKHHFHMNATRWVTLTGLVKWLGRESICEVEDTPKGWFIKYIDRSPETLARQAAAEKKDKMDKDDEERSQKMIELQISRALASKKEEDEVTVSTELQRTNEEEKVVFNLSRSGPSGSGAGSTSQHEGAGERSNSSGSPENTVSDQQPGSSGPTHPAPPPQSSGSGSDAGGGGFSRNPVASGGSVQPLHNALRLAAGKTTTARKKEASREDDVRGGASNGRKRKLTALEEIRMMEEQRKEKMNRRDNWLAEGVVVKVVHRKLGERYYRKKGVVEEVKDLFTGIVRMADSGDRIRIDQAHLETVIPAIGKPVMVVNGAYRGLRAVLESLDADNFCVSVRIDQGPARGRLLERVPYEDISKLA